MDYIDDITHRSHLSKGDLISRLGIAKSRYYQWKKRRGKANAHNGRHPKKHWLLPEERTTILDYCRSHGAIGYRRLTYMMLDEDVAAVSPSTTYRLLKQEGLLCRWPVKTKAKGQGFQQPLNVHDHWHIDISYVNILGTILFLITVLDGASRYVLHHELRQNMTEYDVELTLEKAREKFPEGRGNLISDNGSPFISKEFKEYMRHCGFKHVRTSVGYPQSNGKLERYHGTIKREAIRRTSYLSIEEARRKIASYIDRYNHKRLHSAIYYLSPADVLYGRVDARLKERQDKLDQAKLKRQQAYRRKQAASSISSHG